MKEIWKSVKKNVPLGLSCLDKSCTRTNRELVYGAVACTAVGIVLGIILSPKKSTSIGSHNGNHPVGCPSQNLEGEEITGTDDEN